MKYLKKLLFPLLPELSFTSIRTAGRVGLSSGIKGDNINFLAQIVTVADVYDALTSERPYRKARMLTRRLKCFPPWGRSILT